MYNEAQRKRALEIVHLALSDSISLAEVTLEMSKLEAASDPLVAAAIHTVMHFLTDVDIRQSDKEYNAIARGQLVEMVMELQSGRNA